MTTQDEMVHIMAETVCHGIVDKAVLLLRERQIAELRDALSDLYSWIEVMPIKHPMQAHWRSRAKKLLFPDEVNDEV